MRSLSANPDLATEADAHYYVLAAVRSSALQLFERRRRLRQFADIEEPGLADSVSDPLRIALDQEADHKKRALTQKTLNALRELPEHQREAVELLVLREPPMKLREVAVIQGAPISTVHSRLQAALRELARQLRGEP